MEEYKRFQLGTPILVIFGASLIFMFFAYQFQWGNNPIPTDMLWVMSLGFLVIITQFYGMTISVQDNFLKYSLGIGLISRKIDIANIREVEIVRNGILVGFGIRYVGNGWLFNVAGLSAIEIKYKHKNSILQLGSADCENLKAILDKKITK